MIQTVTTAQDLFAKACLVDRSKLRDAQTRRNIVDAEECLKQAFFTDVKPLLAEWRTAHQLDPDPLAAYRASGYESKVAAEREASRAAKGKSSAGGTYA
jgi:L-rhamnose isomerase/sugar isomerase